MNYETIDILYRSRLTLLEHLEKEGYNVTPFMKFSPKEISEMIRAGPPALQMDLAHTEDPEKRCLVVYTILKIKQKLASFTHAIVDPEDGSFDPSKTEVIIITLEPIAPNFHTMAFECYAKFKAKVRYFQAAALVNNPLHHFLVPKHEKVSKEDEKAILDAWYAKKSQLPKIRFHEDPIARMIGLMPDEIVKITRPSLTAGECVLYRLCVP